MIAGGEVFDLNVQHITMQDHFNIAREKVMIQTHSNIISTLDSRVSGGVNRDLEGLVLLDDYVSKVNTEAKPLGSGA